MPVAGPSGEGAVAATPVLVTGGSGFVGSHLVKQLLEHGYRVRTTVRSLGNTGKVEPLLAMQHRHPGRLELFEADLLRPGSFADAAAGCSVVFHVASPFKLPEEIVDGASEMLEPALSGTRNVLTTVDETPSVRRVVLTSTVGAMFGEYIDVLAMRDHTLSEEYFNTSSTLESNPYHFAKTAAEKLAWQMQAAQDRWSMVSINPGLVLGPSLTPESESGSLFLLDELFRGFFFYGAPNFSFTVVDVRDVALAHIRAAERTGTHGRFILAHQSMVSFLEMSKITRPGHRRPYLLPRHSVPDIAVRVLGPRFGLTQTYIRHHLGIRFAVDNRRSIDELGIVYRPVAETLRDHHASWAAARATT